MAEKKPTKEEQMKAANEVAVANFGSALPYLAAMLTQSQTGKYGVGGSQVMYTTLYQQLLRGARKDGPLADAMGRAYANAASMNAQRGGQPWGESLTGYDLLGNASGILYGENGSLEKIKVGQLLEATGYKGKIDSKIKDMYVSEALDSKDKKISGLVNALVQDSKDAFLDNGLGMSLEIKRGQRNNMLEQMLNPQEEKTKK